MQLPLLLSQLALFRAASGVGNRVKYMVLCGALVGVASLFKQVAALHWIFLVLAYLMLCGEKHKSLAFAGWSAGGAVAVWGRGHGLFLARKRMA